MLDMHKHNAPTLPLPEATLWYTRKAAGIALGVHWRTVDRMINDGLLHAYAPQAAPGEKPPILLFVPEVKDLAHARARSRKSRETDS